jgi:glycerol-3-phosphate cytidylyltransferase
MIRVYVDVVADLFHNGHLQLFKKAKQFGDYLVVGIHSDLQAESYKRKPIFSENHRYEIVKNCRLVDEIIPAAPTIITEKFIKDNNIDFVVHGDDIRDAYSEQHKDPIRLGIMKYVPYTKGISTSKIIERIKNGSA